MDGAAVVDSPLPDSLTPAQWQALARLADRLVALEEAGAGPLGQVASDWALKAAAVVQGRDLETLGEELWRAIQALSQAGLWAAIADNAPYLKSTLDAVPWSALGDTQVIPEIARNAEGLKHDLGVLRALVGRLAALEELWAGPTGQALSEAWVKWSAATEAHDLAALGQDLTRALNALSASGLLRFLSENLAYFADSLRSLGASSPELLAALGPVLKTVREDLLLAHKLAESARHLEPILAGPTGAAAASAWVTASEAFAEKDLGGLARDMVDLLAAWRRMGLFPVLRDAGGGLAAIATMWQAADGNAVLQEKLRGWAEPGEGPSRWQQAGTLWDTLKNAAATQEPAEGGVKGLYKLLTDPLVQDAVRQGAVLLRLAATTLAPSHETGSKQAPEKP